MSFYTPLQIVDEIPGTNNLIARIFIIASRNLWTSRIIRI